MVKTLTSTTPGRRPFRPKASEGFTLIEMLAALTVIVLAMVVVSVRVGSSTDRLNVEALAAETAARVRAVRDHAIRRRRNGTLVFDASSRRVVGTPPARPVSITEDISIDIVTGGSSGANSAIRFFPNGMSTGGTIRLAGRGAAYEVRVSWFNGRVTVVKVS